MWGVPVAPLMNYLTQPFKLSTPKALDLSLALLLITSHLICCRGTLTFVQGHPLLALDTTLPCLPFQCVTDWEGA